MNIQPTDHDVHLATGISIGTVIFHFLAKGAGVAEVIAPYVACVSGLASVALVIRRWNK